MIKFLLIFLSSCTFGQYDCVHEILTYKTYADCKEAQDLHDNYRTVCAMAVEGSNREIDIQSIGQQP